MDFTSHLNFNSFYGELKPKNIIDPKVKCPFCDRESLENILDQDGDILLVKNKYPVLEDTFQTVLIETKDCNSELSLYSKEHLYRLISFGVRNWLNMENNGLFKSVIYYKNHGPRSGGTIRHPHMQIVGLKKIDYHQNIKEEHFTGILIDQQPNVEFTLSTQPLVGFVELNVILHDLSLLNKMSDYLQIGVHYILNHYHKKKCTSYNLFFYHLHNKIIVKIVPRFLTSPLFIGYSIPQVSDRIPDIVKKIQQEYFL